MDAIEKVEAELKSSPRKWLVTGAAGFIGSHILARLLSLGQQVVVLDNFETGKPENLTAALAQAGKENAKGFQFIEADVRNLASCRAACAGVNIVLHQAGLGSVPRSIENPIATHEVNVSGFLNMIFAARDAGVGRFVYATSSSVYGNMTGQYKVEDEVGEPLSPYALSKKIDELYAKIFAHTYAFESIGLRYFNVFGARQDPEGPYAAVIPRFVSALAEGKRCTIYGDGETSRDFCYVDNVVQANILAGTAPKGSTAVNQVYNVGAGRETSLNQLHGMIRDRLAEENRSISAFEPVYQPFREGDVRRSLADINKARTLLGYAPGWTVATGLARTIDETLAAQKAAPSEQRHPAASEARPIV
jgi:UDP-N-acetylglucosamine 4-epimerase